MQNRPPEAEQNFGKYLEVEEGIKQREENDREQERYYDHYKEKALREFRNLLEIEGLRGSNVNFSYVLRNKDSEGYSLRPEAGIRDEVLSEKLIEDLGQLFDDHYKAGAVEFRIQYISSSDPKELSVEEFRSIVDLPEFRGSSMSQPWQGREIDCEIDGKRARDSVSDFMNFILKYHDPERSKIKIFLLGWNERERDTEYGLKKSIHYHAYEGDGRLQRK